jgi:hypothetical protein
LIGNLWYISSVSALASYWLEDCTTFKPTPEENDQYDAPTTLSAIQTACQFTFINEQFYSLVISGDDKNKQLTLLSQCKLALTARNTLLHYKIIRALKKFKNPYLSLVL